MKVDPPSVADARAKQPLGSDMSLSMLRTPLLASNTYASLGQFTLILATWIAFV